MEAQQDLRAWHGFDAEMELTKMMGDAMAKEVGKSLFCV